MEIFFNFSPQFQTTQEQLNYACDNRFYNYTFIPNNTLATNSIFLFFPSILTVTSTFLKLTLLWVYYSPIFHRLYLPSSCRIEDRKVAIEDVLFTNSFDQINYHRLHLAHIFSIFTTAYLTKWLCKSNHSLPKYENISGIKLYFFLFSVISLKIESYNLSKKWWTLKFTLKHF